MQEIKIPLPSLEEWVDLINRIEEIEIGLNTAQIAVDTAPERNKQY